MKRCPSCGRESVSGYLDSRPCFSARDSILLVHARNFKGRFTASSSFTPNRRTLEECVAREVKLAKPDWT